MQNFFKILTYPKLEQKHVHLALLLFRVLVSIELIVVHGFKKLGIGTEVAEIVPNPLGILESVNQLIAIAANIVFPIFIIFGFITRLSALPITAVTLTGYFVVHVHDPLIVKDVPFMYSLVFLFLLVVGPGKYSLDEWIYNKISK